MIDQSLQGEESPHKTIFSEEVGAKLKGEAPGVTEPISQGAGQKGEVPHLPEIQVALDQIEAIGDCLVAIGEAKEFELRKKTLVSLGILIPKVTGIIKELLNTQRVKEI
jgi:hypothetical protein